MQTLNSARDLLKLSLGSLDTTSVIEDREWQRLEPLCSETKTPHEQLKAKIARGKLKYNPQFFFYSAVLSAGPSETHTVITSNTKHGCSLNVIQIRQSVRILPARHYPPLNSPWIVFLRQFSPNTA